MSISIKNAIGRLTREIDSLYDYREVLAEQLASVQEKIEDAEKRLYEIENGVLVSQTNKDRLSWN